MAPTLPSRAGPITNQGKPVAFIGLLNAAIQRDSERGCPEGKTFTHLLQGKAKAALQALPHPWMGRLASLRGARGHDGVERLSTQAIFDHLEVEQIGRTSAAARQLSRLMSELGWTPIRLWSLNQRGVRDQIRGYAKLQTG